jgi:hypothetical protein
MMIDDYLFRDSIASTPIRLGQAIDFTDLTVKPFGTQWLLQKQLSSFGKETRDESLITCSGL